MKIENKVIVVTGGGKRYWAGELVLGLLARDARVAVVDISEPAVQETIRLAGSQSDRLSSHVINITDRQAVEALPDQVIAKHGSVDGVINNAGIIQPFVRLKIWTTMP